MKYCWLTLRRHVPLALVVVMLAGVSLPAEAKKDEAEAPVAAAPAPADKAVSAAQVAAAPTAPVDDAPVPGAEGSGEGSAGGPAPAVGDDGEGEDESNAFAALPGEAEDIEGEVPGKGNGVIDEAEDVIGGLGKAATGVASPAKGKGKPVGGAASAPPPAPAPAPAPVQPAAAPPATPEPTGEVPRRESSEPPVAERRRPAARPQAGPGFNATTGDPQALASADVPAAAAVPDTAADEGKGSPAPERADPPAEPRDEGSPVTRTVREIVEVVPKPLKVALALLAGLTVLFGGGYLFAALRARRLGRQRRELLQEVGLLQAALLPPVPANLGAVRASVAYRPADGPGAGGDFYDALTLPGGRAAFILGDVSGHGRAALAHTAFMRYTLRAYLEAGLEPRLALQVAERAVGGQLDGDFATVIVAVHDPADGSLTYASAGHPAPIVAGGAKHEPVLAAWSPPIGWGLPTGLRQTTVPLPSGAIACLYTDGLAEASTDDGILGRARLAEIVSDCGREATAQDLLDRVVAEAVNVRDDMAACLIAPVRHVTAGAFRTELLELGPSELHEGLAVRFLEECHVAPAAIEAARQEAHYVVDEHGGALMVVNFGVGGSRVQVLPRNVESLKAATLRKAAAHR